MSSVQFLDTISVSYTATLPSGEVIESVPEERPLTLAIGSGQILLAAEAAMVGMEPGQTRTVDILPEDAYGPYYPFLVQEVPRASFSGRPEPRPGMILSLTFEREGKAQQVPATVLAAGKDTVTVDYNHPLAGKTITYTLKVHAIGH